MPYYSKCFTYVAKTRANLTTYSRKPKNYNGTIIFEINIMKKSSPINLNLCQTLLFHKIFVCFFWFDLPKLSWECCESSRKEVVFWFWQWQKMWILNWVGMSFLRCQSQKSPGFLFQVRNSFGDMRETFTVVCT